MSGFELVQVHECQDFAEVVIRDPGRNIVFSGNINKVKNPGSYSLPKEDENGWQEVRDEIARQRRTGREPQGYA